MDNFLANWENRDFQTLIVGFIIAITMIIFSYKWYRNYKDDNDTGEWYSVMNGWDIVKWVIMAIFFILALISQIDFS